MRRVISGLLLLHDTLCPHLSHRCMRPQHGCLVVNAPTANTVAAAEHSIALLCSMARNIPAANAAVKAGKWDQRGFVGTSLAGKTLAVFGFGKVRLAEWAWEDEGG